jgi:hypothetical protein
MYELRRYEYVCLEEANEACEALGSVEEGQLDREGSSYEEVRDLSCVSRLFAYGTVQALHVLHECEDCSDGCVLPFTQVVKSDRI